MKYGGPGDFELDGPDFELGIPFECPEEDHVGYKCAHGGVPVAHSRGVTKLNVALAAVGPHPECPGVKAEGHLQVLRRCPQGVVHRLSVSMLHGAQGDHGPRQAQFGYPFQLFNTLIYVIYVDHADSLEPVWVGSTPDVCQPAVVSLETGREQFAIGESPIWTGHGRGRAHPRRCRPRPFP